MLWGGLGDLLIEKRTRHVGLYLVVITVMSSKALQYGVELTTDILLVDNTAPKAETLENLLMWARNQKYDGDSCNNSVEYPVIRYMLKLEISDDTAEVVVVMFDETATSLLKCSASSILDFEDQVYFSASYNLANTFTDLRLQDEEDHLGLPPALARIVGTSDTLELKPHTYYEHGTYESFTCWKAPALKRLNKFPSVATPSKPDEEKKQRREELEDSDVEGSFVAGSQLKGGDNAQI
nr:hypothetical protein [Tanacetum cinerariifolium]